MPNRAHQPLAPGWMCPWPVPSDRAPWSVYEEPKPRVLTSQEWLGQKFDPTCPTCGVETDEGRILPEGDRYRVVYQCGHEMTATLDELKARTIPHAV